MSILGVSVLQNRCKSSSGEGEWNYTYDHDADAEDLLNRIVAADVTIAHSCDCRYGEVEWSQIELSFWGFNKLFDVHPSAC